MSVGIPTPRRRALLLGAGALAAWAVPRAGGAQPAMPAPAAPAPAAAPTGPFILPALPYAPDANEPHIDALTITLHHDRHHAAYVANLNAAVRDYPQLGAMPIEELLARVAEVPEAVRTAVRNNGGGHANHSMFWGVMGGRGGAPGGELALAVDRDLGGFARLQSDFNGAGVRQFGSGWVFITVDREGKLAIVSRPNQDTPLLEGGRVLLGNDVWEHAYYLKYQNRRPDYLAAWWNVVNWGVVAERYAAVKGGTLKV